MNQSRVVKVVQVDDRIFVTIRFPQGDSVYEGSMEVFA